MTGGYGQYFLVRFAPLLLLLGGVVMFAIVVRVLAKTDAVTPLRPSMQRVVKPLPIAIGIALMCLAGTVYRYVMAGFQVTPYQVAGDAVVALIPAGIIYLILRLVWRRKRAD